MFELATKPKKTYRYEPIERRRADRRSEQADRRAESRDEESESDRREKNDRRKK